MVIYMEQYFETKYAIMVFGAVLAIIILVIVFIGIVLKKISDKFYEKQEKKTVEKLNLKDYDDE